MTFHELNILPKEELRKELYRCCGSACWVDKMLAFFPMDDLVEMLEDAEEQWYTCGEADWREAFVQHPEIGDTDALAKKFPGTAQWAVGEQSAVDTASSETLNSLVAANKAYREKFGYIFIVSATGKTAAEMLDLLNQRLSNEPGEEIQIAAEEQAKITLIRLQKLIT